MSNLTTDKNFWNERYATNDTGWDIGYVSTPIQAYIDQLHNKYQKILIPGAGNSYEAEYLHLQSFQNVHVLDISERATDRFKNRVSDFPESQIHTENFFEHQDTYDLILEQTFFCALSPDLRETYVHKMYDLISPGGKLAGLLFNIPLYNDHPPYGGNTKEYIDLFSEKFDLLVLDKAYNSIPERLGNELFFIFKSKKV